jgi:hypothetical protein
MIIKKISVVFCLMGLLSCQSTPRFEPAKDPLEAGRYFVESCLKGEFKEAQFYILKDTLNQLQLDSISESYHQLDKEGRQQLRQASIQINNVTTLDSNNAVLQYQNSFEKIARSIKIVRNEHGWQVNLK